MYNSSTKDNVLLMFEVKLISILFVGWWVGLVLSKDILLKCIVVDDRYSSAGVGGLCVGIFSSLQGWLCVEVLCALQCAKNSVGACRQSLGCLNVCRMSFRVTYNEQVLPKCRESNSVCPADRY